MNLIFKKNGSAVKFKLNIKSDFKKLIDKVVCNLNLSSTKRSQKWQPYLTL